MIWSSEPMYVRAPEPMAGEEKLIFPPVKKLQASEDVDVVAAFADPDSCFYWLFRVKCGNETC